MLKTIYTSTYPIDCHIIKGRLETDGIISFIYDEHLVWVDPFRSVAIGGVKLKVPSDQLNLAKQILDLISEGKLVDNHGQYAISEALDKSIQRQNEILEHKYWIRKDKTWTTQSDHIRSEILSQAEIDNLVNEEHEFKKLTDKEFKFSWKDFWAELLDFNGRIFKYLRPKPIDYFLDKEIVDWYKNPLSENKIRICPNCNSDDVSYGYAIDYKWDVLYLILSLISAPFPLIRKNCHCFNCGYNFKKSEGLPPTSHIKK